MKTKNRHNTVLAVDIDDTIATGRFWVEGEAQPIQENLDRINRLYKDGYVIIYHTARHPQHYALTYAWLIEHGAFFHALEMGKLAAEFYIDNKALYIDDINSLINPDHE